MDDCNFTEREIQDQLNQLGYTNVSADKLSEFKKDLENLVRHERSKNSSWSTMSESGASRVVESMCEETILSTQHSGRVPLPRQHNHHSPVSERGQYNQLKQELKTARMSAAPGARPRTANRGFAAEGARPRSTNNGVYTYYHNDDADENDISVSTTASSDTKRMKRKVSRRVEGRPQVFNESFISENDFNGGVEDRLEHAPLAMQDVQRPKTAVSGERRRIYGMEPASRPQSARQSRDADTTSVFEDGPVSNSVIKPMTCHPHTRNIKKTDVVNRGRDYRNIWTNQKAPGEDLRRELRWDVRGQMLYHDEVVEKKQQRAYVPNKYTAPSEKKRKSLIWQIRQDLAQGLIPSSQPPQD